MPGYMRVEGLRELNTALRQADRQVRLGIRGGLRHVAEPVQRGAEELAQSQIRRMPKSPRWSKMRIGLTRDLVYVAPRERGTRGKGGKHRPNLASLLMDRAMEPALEKHASEIERRFEELLDHAADDFNH